MLVDKMEYQGQQGIGEVRGDASRELLPSTAVANDKKLQHYQQQFGQQQFDASSDDRLPNHKFQSNSSSYGDLSNGKDMLKAPARAPAGPSYPTASPYSAAQQHLPIPSFVERTFPQEERGNVEAATVAAVEQIMKKYVHDLMRMMESMNGRIGQLESLTRRLEQMVTDFKDGSEKSQEISGDKILFIKTMLSEVQRGVQSLRNKREVMEAPSNIEKRQFGGEGISLSSGHNHLPLLPPSAQSPRAPQLPETPSYQMGQFSPPPHYAHHPPGHPPPPYMVPAQMIGLPPSPPPPPPAPEPHCQTSQQLPPSPQQSYYGQQQHPHGLFPHPPAEIPSYGATIPGPYKGQSGSFGQEVPPSPYGSQSHQSPLGGPGGSQMYNDQSAVMPPLQFQGRPGVLPYEQSMGPSLGYSNPGYGIGQQTLSAPSSGAGGYPRLPTAQPVKHAMPTARTREGAPTSSGATPVSTNRMSIDEVIDRVASMGFSKDQVRAVVRGLSENSQAVDFNIVLDKLVNGEAGVQPPKGWFQRG